MALRVVRVVSNSDNLGARMLDLKLLIWLAQSGKLFAVERTEADKKGVHLAADATTGGLLLHESAQCPDADEKEVPRHHQVQVLESSRSTTAWCGVATMPWALDAVT